MLMVMERPADYGQWLKGKRKRAGLSQKKLGDLAGIDRRRIIDLVFAGDDGQFRRPAVVGRAFRRANEAAGVPRLTLHQLRHTSATLQLGAGVHPWVVQRRMGHASMAMTAAYSHVSVEMQRSVADGLGEALGPLRDTDVTLERSETPESPS